MKIHSLIALAVISLAGCANTETYKMYAEGQAKVDEARYLAEAAKYKAMSDIAITGDSSAKVAAVMAMVMGNSSNNNNNSTQLRAPESNSAIAFQWASLLIPSVTQIYGIRSNAAIAQTNSDNAARVAESTNNAFVGIAGKIQAPAANISTTTNTLSGSGTMGAGAYTASTLSGTGTLGSGTFSSTDNHAVSTTTDNHASTTDNHAATTDNHTTNPSTITPAGKVCAIDPITNVLTCQ